MPADNRGKNLIMENKNPLNTKDYCPKCECLWAEHDFGVPEPYCPGPIVNKEAAQKSEEERHDYNLRKLKGLKEILRTADEANVKKSFELFNSACRAIEQYLSFNAWRLEDDGTFNWVDPETAVSFTTVDAFKIQNYKDLQNRVKKDLQ